MNLKHMFYNLNQNMVLDGICIFMRVFKHDYQLQIWDKTMETVNIINSRQGCGWQNDQNKWTVSGLHARLKVFRFTVLH